MTQNVTCDVLIAGSGAGALSCAVTAKQHGLDVLIVEKEEMFGGTTSYSGGFAWLPGNPVSKRLGIVDSIDDARIYIKHSAQEFYDSERVEAFLTNGPRMVEYFEREIGFEWTLNRMPDYQSEAPGASKGGRTLGPAPLPRQDCRPWIDDMRPPRPEHTVFGGMRISSGDKELGHFLKAGRSLGSMLYVIKRGLAYAWDRIRYGHDMRLVNGNALLARLGKATIGAGVPLWLSSPMVRLIVEDGRVVGAIVRKQGVEIEVRARRGVVLATGGFPHDIERRKRLYKHAAGEHEHISAAAPGNSGDGLNLAEGAGGSVESYLYPAAWCPLSHYEESNSGIRAIRAPYDRTKPGFLAVAPDGKRFVAESNSYQVYVAAIIEKTAPATPAYSYYICDHRTARRYGLGLAKPFPFPIGPHIGSGYIVHADTIEDLARSINIDPIVLSKTVADFNAYARAGKDPDFHSGESTYNRYLGDPEHKPNSSLGPVEIPPFYALKMWPGDLGTFAGIKTDGNARALTPDGKVIPGLYAAGNDMASVFGGAYLAGGCTLGPALTFGYVAGMHLTEKD